MDIHIDDDFSPALMANSGQCFRARELSPGLWRFVTGRRAVKIRELGAGDFRVSASAQEWETLWLPYFDLGRNYRALRAAIPEEDTFLRTAAAAARGLRILRQDPWEMLVTFIISQRKSIPAIAQAVERLCAHGVRIGAGLRGFPEPRRLRHLSATDLRAMGLGYRDVYLKAAIERMVSAPEDWRALATPALLEALQTLPGVGIKVASCVALFGYARLEVAPVDTWMLKIFRAAYGGRRPAWMDSPLAGLYQQYVFHWAITHRAQINAAAGSPS